MSVFCEGCPMRGEIEGEVIDVIKGTLEHKWIFSRDVTDLGTFAVLMDNDRSLSEPVHAPSQNTFDRLTSKLDGCSGPETEQKGLIFKRNKVSCPALGALAVDDTEMRKVFMSRARIEAT